MAETRQTEYIDAADVAKLVRARLKVRFPGQKFSVRTSKYSMGASIDVRWTDGPTEAEVREVTEQFSGSRFDGMIDLKYHAEHWLLPDGTAVVRREYGHSYHDAEVHNEEWTPPEGARLVHFMADYIFTQRDTSEEKHAELVAAWERYYGETYDANRYYERLREFGNHSLYRFRQERGL